MTDKTFSHAVPFQQVIDGAQYDNNEPVSSSPNFSQVVIHGWENVKALDQTAITSSALTYGYTAID